MERKMKYMPSANVKCASHMKYRPTADVKYSSPTNVKVTVCFANEKQLPKEAVWYDLLILDCLVEGKL